MAELVQHSQQQDPANSDSRSAEQLMIDPTNVLAFMEVVGKLKHVKRTGWVRSGITLPESVADHMYKMSMMTFMLRDPTIDKDKLLKSKTSLTQYRKSYTRAELS